MTSPVIFRFGSHSGSLWMQYCGRLISPRLTGIAKVILLGTLLPGTVQGQEPLELTIVGRPLDTLTLSGGPFPADRNKICIRFSGHSECVVPSSVSADLRDLQIVIPVDAISGPVAVQVATATVGTAQLKVDRSDTMQSAMKYLVDAITKNLLAYLVALAGLGVLSMSIVQAIKTLLPVPQFYQWLRTRWWLRACTREAKRNLKEVVSVNAVEKELVVIGAGGNTAAFYSSQGDEFVKQLTIIGRLVLNYPTNNGRYLPYGSVLAVLASNITKADFDLLNQASKGPTPQQKLDAFNRVQQQMTQAISAFCISSTWWWQNGLHVAAFLTSFVLVYLAVRLGLGGVKSTLSVALTALLGAFLAPVARDLVAAIQKLRSP